MPETSLILRAKDFTKQAFDQIQQSLNKTADHFNSLAAESKQMEKGLVGSLNRVKVSLEANREGFQAIAIGAGAVAASTGLLAKSFVDAAMRMERMKMGLIAVMGSAKGAEEQFARLREVAKLPGLGLQEAVQGATRLQVVGTSAEEAARQLTAFGGAVARAGGGREELARVVEQIAQMASKSEVLMEDFRPIVSIMPDIVKAMNTAFGTKSVEQIREMGITSRQFIAGVTTELLKLPGVGNTAANAVENLSDSMFILRSELGQFLLPVFSKIINAMSSLVTWINSLSNTQKSFLAWGTAITAVVATLVTTFMGFLAILPSIIAGVTTLGITLAGLVAAAGPIGLAIAAIGALTAGIILWRKHQEDSRITAEKFSATMEKVDAGLQKLSRIEILANQMEALRSKTNLTSEESQKLHEIQKELAELSPRLVAGYDAQGNILIKTKKQVIEYTEEQKKLLEAEKELTRLHAQRRLPELGKDIEKATKRLEEYEKLLKEKPITTKGTFWIPDPRMPGQVLATYDQLLKVMKKQNEKVQALVEERRDLEAQLKGKPYGPSAPLPKEPEEPLSKKQRKAIEEMEEDIREARAKTAELAAMVMKKGIERETALERAKYEKEKSQLEVRLAEIKGTSEREQELKRVLLSQMTALEEAYNAKVAEIRDKYAKEEQDRINAWVRDRVRAGVLATQAEDAMRKKMVDGVLSTYVEMKQLEENFAKKRQQDQQKLLEKSLDIAKERFRGIQDEATQEKAEAWLTYKNKEIALQKELNNVDTITQRKAQIETELRLLKENLLAEYDKIDEKYTEIQKDRAQDAADAYWKTLKSSKERVKEIRDKMLDDAIKHGESIEKTWRDVQTGWAKITGEATDEMNKDVERFIERTSDLLAELPFSMAEAFITGKQTVRDVIKDFFLDIGQLIIQETQRIIAAQIAAKLAAQAGLGAVSTGAGAAGAAGGLAPLLGSIAPFALPLLMGGIVLRDLWKGGFDNPINDRAAMTAGRQMAMLYGTSFDNPLNDYRAQMQGSLTASKRLGERSARDLVQNFTVGFERKAMETSEDGKLGMVLSKIEQRLGEIPQLRVYLGDREITSVVRREIDKQNTRKVAY